ncbi:uncharacterized protein LOC127800727 isoform X2 [Diospyros lotus]|uniref:uncharacterized protein LOC127800727 isoform X2 n=1 Tax=Diospyros lotus TaxID=55363 RepID=UPI00225058B5|nr:uncharacterized protein LOC127800727 isoform X2 [Diospyros lotus]
MTVLSNSLVSVRNPRTQFFSGSSLMQVDQCFSSRKLFINTTQQGKAKAPKHRTLTVQARDGGTPNTASIFVGGFVLGGVVVGALGCIYAPQISKALAGADRKDLMRKLPKFIYDEEKALEKTRKILTEKIAQLNSAIDDVSAQLHADDDPNGTAVNPDELEASV